MAAQVPEEGVDELLVDEEVACEEDVGLGELEELEELEDPEVVPSETVMVAEPELP